MVVREKSSGTETEAAVAFHGVRFSYEGRPVIDRADFEIPEGHFVSVIGPNGGGKTTLARLILGLLQPDTGHVSVFGQNPETARPLVGYVPQYSHFDPRFPVTVLDVALMGRVRPAFRRYKAVDREVALASLEEVGLGDQARRAFADLSGGERQRVLIARALATRPRMLLLDEPTANVDAAVESRLSTLLRSLAARMTLMLITHDLGFVSESITHVVCVNRNVRIHPTAEVTPEMISMLYGTNVRMVRHDVQSDAYEGGHRD